MIPVIDVFAGPGGLNEGFSTYRQDGEQVFNVAASFEMEPNAVQTLIMRSAVRALSTDSTLFDPYRAFLSGALSIDGLRRDPAYADAESAAGEHVHHLELGPDNREEAARRIQRALGEAEKWVLIGGPPCQAYSLVGRSRRAHDPLFEEDRKHFLYREYLDILERFAPPVFVMENVKGLLSAGHGGSPMFTRILDDLRQRGRYTIRSLVVDDPDPAPKDFVVRAENYGVPQRRHRVILLGIREDVEISGGLALKTRDATTVRQAISGLKPFNAGVSRTDRPGPALARAAAVGQQLAQFAAKGRAITPPGESSSEELEAWLNPYGVAPSLHEQDPRKHMEGDLSRYRFMAEMASRGLSPRVKELPRPLVPEHKNIAAEATPFVDRFKVQSWDAPSSTVASHIAKDGHYYIHPDPSQMRSLSVREAARLQTFPDDYYFMGSRTAQYHQVGNAVPPLLAAQIAGSVARLLADE